MDVNPAAHDLPPMLSNDDHNTTNPERIWHLAYPEARITPARISREAVLQLVTSATKPKEYVLVDLRRDDFKGGAIDGYINLPAQSLYPTIPALYALFQAAGVRQVICYCGSSCHRGPRAAGWFADYVAAQGAPATESLVMTGGMQGWAAGGPEFVRRMHRALFVNVMDLHSSHWERRSLSAIGFSLAENVYHSLHNTVVGNLTLALAGNISGYWVSAATIDTLGRWLIQSGSFAILTILFCIFGFTYHSLSSSSLIALYVLCPSFSNSGANSTTFIVFEEIFRTRSHSTVHGLSAGAGKLGAVITQALVRLLKNKGATDKSLNHVMQIFAAFMVCRLGTTLLIPETKRQYLEYLI
ncbi:hypothetical protein LTR78_010399 [Recurvomyces mirabilis]|uniref:Rhodanese domain-containing protein n=1 Tax=Recurvomyces mirabilis TaxID=574656 RepID=A0AAE0TPT4_9PEZI|nr:hypothetical protein LTR78_010399 [Recurvomyces mirabilis]KAK5149766.1 Inorganic phosphate transporter pho84 [Recurvomyces mirabilis]